MSNLFTDEQTHPIILMRTLTKKYGPDWTTWGPVVPRESIQANFNVTISRLNLNKALAAGVVATQDSFWTEWESFLFLVQALNNNIPISGELLELTVGQMMVAVDIANQIRRELKNLSYVPEFSEDVARFIAAQAKNQGVWYLPPPLDFAAKYAAGIKYRCRSCGNTDELLFHDGVCDSCSDRFMEGGVSQLTSWRPNPAYVKDAKNIEVFEQNPTDKVKARLDQILGGKDVTLQENQVDACVARLLVAQEYLTRRQEQYKAQIGASP